LERPLRFGFQFQSQDYGIFFNLNKLYLYTQKENTMKIDIKSGGKKFTVNFTITPGRGDIDFTAIAKSSKDLDVLYDAIDNRNAGEDLPGVIIARALEKKLKLPIDPAHGYTGAGFGFKFDKYSIAKSLK
jgi:hypothetical protein